MKLATVGTQGVVKRLSRAGSAQIIISQNGAEVIAMIGTFNELKPVYEKFKDQTVTVMEDQAGRYLEDLD